MIIDGRIASESERMRTLISLERDHGALDSPDFPLVLRGGKWYVNYGAVLVEPDKALNVEEAA